MRQVWLCLWEEKGMNTRELIDRKGKELLEIESDIRGLLSGLPNWNKSCECEDSEYSWLELRKPFETGTDHFCCECGGILNAGGKNERN